LAGATHERLEQLFSAALKKTSWEAKNAFLDAECADDPELRRRVKDLLETHERVGSFLDSPPVNVEEAEEDHPPDEAPGARLGRYRIVRKIGEGGFGSVHLAEQEEPVRRKVALKIIKLGMDTKQVIARFEAERQAVAMMDHPNIAQVFDAGTTDTGRPYFVMELVLGVPITQYCDKKKLSTRERLELFVPVCHAVQHAHQKGIIHRDLKPRNVLVTLQNDQPVPKVIDFGIAKAIRQRLTEKTYCTGFREMIGTPQYMSPEQAGTGVDDVDTRADIFTLGVMLYELLAGVTPFDLETLRKATYDELQRTIREVDPPKPSARVQGLGETEEAIAIAARRRTQRTVLLRILRGDLDWIVMKAMDKDRARRYATAKDLADDIERHLRHEPVVAGPPGAAYHLRKFLRRNRFSVAAGGLICAALVIGILVSTVGLVQANRARRELQVQRDAADASARAAEAETAKSSTVSEFLQAMLSSADPRKALGREVTVRFLLDQAAREIDEGALEGQPEVEATVRMTLGETYKALGLYEAAEEHVRKAGAIRGERLGDEDPGTLRAERALAGVLRVKGDSVAAESLLRRTADAQRRILGDEHPDTLATMTELALTLGERGKLAEAESIHRRTLAIQMRVLGEDRLGTLESMGYLGAVCRALGKTSEAEALLRRALESCRRVLGNEHPSTAVVMNNLGLLLEDQGHHEQAEDLYRRTYELNGRILGPDHPQTLLPMNDLLRVLHIQGKAEAIQPLLSERLAGLRRAAERPGAGALALHAYAWELLNNESIDLRDPEAALPFARRAVELDGGRDASLLDTLASAYSAIGDLDRAIETQRQAIVRARIRGPYNRTDLEARLVEYLLRKGDLLGVASASWGDLAERIGESLIPGSVPGESLVSRSEVLIDDGRYEEAASLLRGCLSMRQKALPEGHWLIADTISRLGAAVAGTGDRVGAERLLLEGHAGLERDHRTPVNRTREAIQRLVRLYEAWGKPNKASEWRLRLAAGEETLEEIPEDSPNR